MKFNLKPLVLAVAVTSVAASTAFAVPHKATVKPPKNLKTVKDTFSLKPIPDVAIGRPVYTAPYMGGTNSRYNMSNLVININDINRDLILLQQNQKAADALKKKHYTVPNGPIMSLSGELQGKVFADRDYNGPTKSDVDLSTAKIDAIVSIAPWVSGFMTLTYDDAANSNGSRISNSRLYVDNAFVTLGDLNKTPFYGTIGQLYVPFGRYSSSLIATPLTQAIGETNERAISLGMKTQGTHSFHAVVYTGRGEIKVGDAHADKINQLGGNLGYVFNPTGFVTFQAGAGYIGNIADSGGMQHTGSKGAFTGFGNGAASSNQVLKERVPGVDANGMLGVGSFSFVGEYTGAAKRFDSRDLTFNGHGAKPRALHLEGAYQFKIAGKPSSFAVAYGHSYDALALNLPTQRYALTFSDNFFQNTVFSMEVRHDKNYSKGKTATGQDQSTFDANDLGKSANALTAEVSVYF